MILTRNLHMFQDILEPKVGNKNSSLEEKIMFLTHNLHMLQDIFELKVEN